MRASERASDIESGGSDGRDEEEWDGEKQPKRRLFFSFHIVDERNSDVKIACLSTLSTVHYCSYL